MKSPASGSGLFPSAHTEVGPFEDGLRDLAAGLRRRHMWARLAWLDIRSRYAGSLLGSLWLTANTALIATFLTVIFARTMGMGNGTYAAYVTLGLVIWSLIQTTLSEAPAVFVQAAETLRQSIVPASVQLFRLVWRNVIGFAHGAVLAPVVLLVFAVRPTALWTVVPAMAVLVTALFFASLNLSLLGTRFRDVPQIVISGLQLLFFATPIFWVPATVPDRAARLLQLNPVFAMVDIVRAPLMGNYPLATSWPIASISTAILAVAGLAAYKKWRRRLVYWL